MKPKTFNLICRLSSEYNDPQKVRRLIQSYVDSNVAYLKATIVRNMLEIYVKNNVALNDVHDAAAKLTAKIRNCSARVRALLAFERKTMFMKLLDARKYQKKSKKQMIRTRMEMSKIVRKGTLVWNVLMKQVKEDTEELWKFETRKAKTKFKHSKEKQKVKIRNDESIIDGVAVGENELDL